MTFVIVNPDNSIQNITDTNETGTGIEIMLDPEVNDLHEVMRSRFGHSVFDYTNGAIVLNKSRHDTAMLPILREYKIAALKIEAVARMRQQIKLSSFEEVELIKEFWLSIAPTARQPTVGFQWVIDVYQAGKTAATVVNALTTATEIEAYDVVATPDWPI